MSLSPSAAASREAHPSAVVAGSAQHGEVRHV
jgi:hypothetical protein